MTFQKRNGICEMKPECSKQNLVEKFETDRDLK